MSASVPRREERARRSTVTGFHYSERLLYLALAVSGAALFAHVIIRFFAQVGDLPFVDSSLKLLDGLLLVFIVTELLHTVRAVIAENVLVAEPFLIVGIVAAIRRIIVISAEAPDTSPRRSSTGPWSRWGCSSAASPSSA